MSKIRLKINLIKLIKKLDTKFKKSSSYKIFTSLFLVCVYFLYFFLLILGWIFSVCV